MEAQGPGRRRECPVCIEDSGGGGVCTGRVGVCDSTGPGVETSILEQGRDTGGPASVERRVSHRGTVDSQAVVALNLRCRHTSPGAGGPALTESTGTHTDTRVGGGTRAWLRADAGEEQLAPLAACD
ncbi:unnamed protein product [Rangifer tarandus platyrhynchus]|uniref:Uncharacterized protein n=2 Tax=Rangifer tarandus platyrhynchus TaxID=3082113 RepID=A0ACB0ETG9_RANTA|nr:unnamed protein product [Rangifer tarandus platyrhynchus]CAI9704000.1 unnamed protein product [Rangifer tarandus platyrhynchus]